MKLIPAQMKHRDLETERLRDIKPLRRCAISSVMLAEDYKKKPYSFGI
jgi:hypothetical protein